MFIRTERLLLRPFWPEDANALMAAIAYFDVVKYLARAPWPYGYQDAEHFIAACQGSMLAQARLAIFAMDVEDKPLIGGIGLEKSANTSVAELGYWITPGYQRRGYAQEAACGALELAFMGLGLTTVKAAFFQDNPVSGKLLDSLGFVDAGDDEAYSLARLQNAKIHRRVMHKADWWASQFQPLATAA